MAKKLRDHSGDARQVLIYEGAMTEFRWRDFVSRTLGYNPPPGLTTNGNYHHHIPMASAVHRLIILIGNSLSSSPSSIFMLNNGSIKDFGSILLSTTVRAAPLSPTTEIERLQQGSWCCSRRVCSTSNPRLGTLLPLANQMAIALCSYLTWYDYQAESLV